MKINHSRFTLENESITELPETFKSNDDFNNWINGLDCDITEDEIIKQPKKNQILDCVYKEIHRIEQLPDNLKNIDEIDELLEALDPLKRSKAKYFIPKAATICIALLAAFFFTSITYASISGRLQGFFKYTPALGKLIDETNPVLEPSLSPGTEEYNQTQCYANTRILTPDSFDYPGFYGVISDVPINLSENNKYILQNIIFDMQNLLLFTKEKEDGWYLNKGDELIITLSIDNTFAASEKKGEYIGFGYALNKKYTRLETLRVTSEPTTYTIIAPESGIYYPGIENGSFTYIKVTHLQIN